MKNNLPSRPYILPILLLLALSPAYSPVWGGPSPSSTLVGHEAFTPIQILYLKGNVTYSQDGQDFRPLQKEFQLEKGHFLRTDENSFVILSFNKNSKIKIAAKSHFFIQEHGLGEKDLPQTSFFLKFGNILVDFITKMAPADLKVETPTFSSSIRGTKFYIDTHFKHDDKVHETLVVFNGNVQINSKKTNQAWAVGGGKGVLIDSQTGEMSTPSSYSWIKDIPSQLETVSADPVSPSSTETPHSQSSSQLKTYLQNVLSYSCKERNIQACAYLNVHFQPDVSQLESLCQSGSTYGCFYLGKWTKLKKGLSSEQEAKLLSTLSPSLLPSDEKAPDDIHKTRQKCFEKVSHACYRYGKDQAEDLEDPFHQHVKEGTGQSYALIKILAQHCGKNEPEACGLLTQLNRQLKNPLYQGENASTSNGQDHSPRATGRSEEINSVATMPPRSPGSGKGVKNDSSAGGESDEEQFTHCLYENVPNTVRFSPQQKNAFCTGLARCYTKKGYTLVNLACFGKKDQCPQATECAHDQKVELGFPHNAKDLSLVEPEI